MANIPISALPNVQPSGYTNKDLLVIVNYDVTSGTTKNTPLSGLTSYVLSAVTSGDTIFSSGLTATTISASTYLGLPLDVYVTGGTYSAGTITFTNNSGATFPVSGLTETFTGGSISSLTATTISAGTYQNLPYVTGGTVTYSGANGTISFTYNTGFTFSATGLINETTTGGTYSEGVYTFNTNSGNSYNLTATTTYSAGIISGGTGWSAVTPLDGQMNLPAVKVALFNNTNNIEPILVYDVASGTTNVGSIPGLTNNATNYIVIDYNNGSPKYDVSTSDTTNDSNIVLAYIVYRLDNFIHVLEFGNYGAGLSNKLNDRFIMTNRFGWESGLSLGLSGSTGVVTLTSGVAWNGSYRQTLVSVNSQDDIFFQNYHIGGSWTAVTTANTLNNTYYDNGTDIVSGNTGKYLVNYYYRGQETNDHLYEVFSTNEYDSVTEAEATTSPLLPPLVSSHAFLVGRIIVGVGETTGITQTAFATVFQPSGFADASGLHNSLQGLQGGVSGEYYHLTSNEYSNLPTKFFSSVTFVGSVQQTVTHNLNTQNIIVQLWDSTNKLINGADIIADTVNTVQITVATGGNYRVGIIG